MLKSRRRLLLVIPVLIIAASLFLSSCSRGDRTTDPGDWGFECEVTYNSLGGIINNREIRQTYYMKNSYVFEPSGSSNMLIRPVKDGYILAGWYKAKEDILDANNELVGYVFKAEDRWDFDEDRIQENVTLYARWIPQAKLEYIDPVTEKIMFTKNITADSGVQPLTEEVAKNLLSKPGYTFEGYYEDTSLAKPYDFSSYEHVDVVMDKAYLYEQLYESFPDYFEKKDYVESEEDEDSEEIIDTSDLFLNKLGYVFTGDKAAREEVRAEKDRIIHENIAFYIENTKDKIVYLKYSEGAYLLVNSVDDLRYAGKTGFFGVDKQGNPVDGYNIIKDLDFKGVSITMGDTFKGEIIGNGHTLSNISLRSIGKQMDRDTFKEISLFEKLEDTKISDLTLENFNIRIDVNPGIKVTAAPLALEAENVSVKNVVIKGLIIDTGKGDDGESEYLLGELFAEEKNVSYEDVKAEDIQIDASEAARVNRLDAE